MKDVEDNSEKTKERRKLREELTDLSNRYYTVIPHNFGRQAPPLIDALSTIHQENQLLQDMIEVKVKLFFFFFKEEKNISHSKIFKKNSADSC